MTHVTCRLTAKNRDRLRNPMLGNWVWATFTSFFTEQAGIDTETLLWLAVWCVIVVTEEDWQGEVDSDAEFNSVFIISSWSRRICQLLCLSPTCEFALTTHDAINLLSGMHCFVTNEVQTGHHVGWSVIYDCFCDNVIICSSVHITSVPSELPSFLGFSIQVLIFLFSIFDSPIPLCECAW